MSLRKQLRIRAETRLHNLIDEVQLSVQEICKGDAVEWTEVMRLALGGRTQALLNKVIGDMANAQEAQLLLKLGDE